MSEEFTQEQINFAKEFARNLISINSYFTPYLINQYLKDINMHPVYQDRDKVENMVYDPANNEQGLRRLSQHLYNTQTPYKRLIHYFADMLTFDYYILPINAKEEDMKKDKFKKEYDEVCNWFDKFNVKKEFSKILIGMLLEDAKFTYLRESEFGLTLQEMPTDYCIIDAWSEFGYLYSFNLLYFLQPGVDINGFAPEFKKYYKNAMDMKNNKKYFPNIRPEQRNGQWFYWQQINPDKGWVFKFDTNFAGLTPPFLGLFIDAIEIDTFKKLQKSKSFLEAYKVIFGTVPRNKDNKSGNKSDDFAIQADTLAEFVKLVKSSLPEGVDFKAVPLENIQAIDFKNSETKSDIVGNAMKNFYRSAGSDQAIFNAEKPSAMTMKASTRIDSAFVERLYHQFELFCTYHINKLTKKYKFKVKFEGTIFDEEDRYKQALELAQNGIITPKIAAAQGLSLKELNDGMALMKMLGYPDKLTPIQTAHTLSQNNKGGRPEKSIDELTPSGEQTKTNGDNLNKTV